MPSSISPSASPTATVLEAQAALVAKLGPRALAACARARAGAPRRSVRVERALQMLERTLGRSHHDSPARGWVQLTSRKRLGGGGQQEPGGPILGSNPSQGGRGTLELLIAGGLRSQVAAQPLDSEARDRPDRRPSFEERCEEPRGPEPVPGDGPDGGDGCRHVGPPGIYPSRGGRSPVLAGGPPGTACYSDHYRWIFCPCSSRCSSVSPRRSRPCRRS